MERTQGIPVAFMMTAGDQLMHWRDDLREVQPGMTMGMLRWFHDHRDRFYKHRGFDITSALRTAMTMSAGKVPIYLLCGCLQPVVPASKEILQLISDAQTETANKRLRCANPYCTYRSCCCQLLWTILFFYSLTAKSTLCDSSHRGAQSSLRSVIVAQLWQLVGWQHLPCVA